MKIVVTIPTYNEAENIERLVRSLLEVDEHVEVLVSDDDSPDGTWQRVADMAATDSRVHLQHRTQRRGRGHAGRDAFCAALSLGADIVVEMDGDGSHDPRELPTLISALSEADIVLGSRLVAGGRDTRPSGARTLLTHVSCAYTRLVLGLPVRDVNSGFRAFRSHALRTIEVHNACSTGPAIVHELLYKAHLRRLRLLEVPITFLDRDKGSSELNLRQLLRSFTSVLRLRWAALGGTLFDAPEQPPPAPLADRPGSSPPPDERP